MVEPNLQSIFITNAIGLALLASLLVSSYLTRERHHIDDRIFTALIFVCAGACVFEPLTFFADGKAEPWAFAANYLGNTYCYLGAVVCPYLWVLYVDLRLHKGYDHIKRWHWPVLAPVIAAIVLNLGNLIGHYMFSISDANVYSRLPLSYLNYALMFYSFFYSIWLKHAYQRKHGRVRFFPLAMFLVPMFIGAGLQAVIYGVSLAWPSVCIGLVSIHMSLQNELSFIDPLTNLYNRGYLDSALKTFERNNQRFSGIMIDLDFFKDINDQYGHSNGDKALSQTARILVASVPEDALVVRFAGDEFIVLLVDASLDEAEQAIRTIEQAIDEFNATSDAPYKLSLSMGASAFSPETDTTDDFLRHVDERMYEKKRIHHEENPEVPVAR